MKTIKRILFIIFLLISISYLFIIISPRVIKDFYPFGIKTAIVLTGSMEPTLNINDFVIMKKPDKIKVNDIVSYKDKNSKNEILHRVVKIKGNKITTKGDANNTEDEPINKNQVTGIYIGKVKCLGNVISFLTRPLVFSIIMALFFLMLIIPTKSEKE